MKLSCHTCFLILFTIPITAVQEQQSGAVYPRLKSHAFLDGPDNCTRCHEEGGKASPSLCLKCHNQISKQFDEKSGIHGNFNSDCTACHTLHIAGSSASPAPVGTFDHAESAGFDLTGRHANLTCEECHDTGSEKKLNSQCGSCHEDAHRGGLGSDCSRCHTPISFENASRAFHKSGTFPLEGRHLALDCDACHLKGEIEGTPNRCYDCHWIRRQDDPFRTQLGSECRDCHDPISWSTVRFSHPSASGVVLNAGHRSLDCEECHTNGNFMGIPVPCYSCHEADYQSTRNPNHVTTGFSTICEDCHRISDPTFLGATFSHSTFRLAGAHATLDCSACHINNIYEGTPQDCYACHESSYQDAQDPNHIAAQFPTDCELCHLPSHLSWDQGSFSHPDFPITSGPHAGYDCSDCHSNPLNYAIFTCTTCHSLGDSAEDHEGVSGYLYDSQACYSCHPQGRH